MRKLLFILILVIPYLSLYGAEYTSSFSVAVLPDTQKYSRYNGAMFDAQTQWIVNNEQNNNIVFTAHLGDFVDRVNQPYEWENADHAISILETHNMPYSVLAGNHDLLDMTSYDDERDRQKEPFAQYFPIERIQNQITYGGHSPTEFNSYHLLDVDGHRFLVLALDWRISEDSLLWAQSILDQYSDMPTILTTHDLVNVDRNDEVYLTRYGKVLWETLIAKNNQIFLTINGHHYNVGHTTFKNDAGNDVLVMVVNYQTDYNGGNGMMRLLTFDIAQNMIYAKSFSPYVMSIPPEQRDEKDIEQKLDPANDFSVEIDFVNRT